MSGENFFCRLAVDGLDKNWAHPNTTSVNNVDYVQSKSSSSCSGGVLNLVSQAARPSQTKCAGSGSGSLMKLAIYHLSATHWLNVSRLLSPKSVHNMTYKPVVWQDTTSTLPVRITLAQA